MPEWSAFRPWRQIPRFALAGVAKAHGDQSQFFRIIKGFFIHAKPVPQVLPTFVIPRNSGLMNLSPRGLADNDNLAALAGGYDGVNTRLKETFTGPTTLYFLEQLIHYYFFCQSNRRKRRFIPSVYRSS